MTAKIYSSLKCFKMYRRVMIVPAVLVLAVVLFRACIKPRVNEELDVLLGYENVLQLRESIKDDDCLVTHFERDGKEYTGVMILTSAYSPLLEHAYPFHQVAPFYIFDRDGRRVDLSRNHNDDGDFHLRWPMIPYGSKKWQRGFSR